MKKSLLLISCSLVAVSAIAIPDYEPFANATGSGGTSYANGSALVGQTDAGGQSWFTAGAGTPVPSIVAGDLTIAGLYSTGGGHSAAFGGLGNNARLNLSIDAGGFTSGTVYFSMAMKLTDLTGMTAGGQFWAGFNTAQGSQTSVPNTVSTRLMTRSATGGYNIGVQEGSVAPLGSAVWGSTVFTTSDTVFVVGSYTFGAGTGDDTSQLWINPSSATFGAGSAPGGSLVSTGGTDIARIASWTLYDRNAAEPAAGQIDDLRFGLSWADVTPAVPEPGSIALGVLGFAGLCLRRMVRKSR